MKESFEELISRVAKDQAIIQGREEGVRQAIILPTLNSLGWNIGDVKEVDPEFAVEDGAVDYCLKVGDKRVFLEIKRVSANLANNEKQLLDYAFKDGVDMAILTNGMSWWLYLPLTKGNYRQRKFFTIDIQQQEPKMAVSHFREFLSRDSIKDNSAIDHAKAMHDSKQKKRLLQQTIPQAWGELFNEPDEKILDLFAEKVEVMCGHRPEIQDLSNYVKSIKAVGPAAVRPTPATPSTSAVSPSPKEPEPSSTWQKGIKVRINDKIIEGNSVRQFYLNILQLLCDSNYIEKLTPYIPYATSNQRYLISTEPFHPEGNEFRAPIEHGGYYMEANKSYDNAFKSLVGLFELCDLSIEKIEDVF
jgi:hypothetical protein